MMKHSKWILILVISLFVVAGVAKAQDVEKSRSPMCRLVITLLAMTTR